MQITYLQIQEDKQEEKVIKMVQEELARMDDEYTLLAMKKLPHKDDNHLRFVLVKREAGYVTWLYNLDNNGFSYGAYFDLFAYNDEHSCEMSARKNFFERYEN